MSNRAPVVTVLGAGAMGTALACLAAERGRDVRLWARRSRVRQEIERSRTNSEYFPGRRLPDGLHTVGTLGESVRDADLLVLAVPSRFIRDVSRKVARYAREDTIVLNAAKGVEFPPLRWMSEVIREEMPKPPIAVMSGPNFASELLDHVPAATAIASKDPAARKMGRACFESRSLRVWETDDVKGVEVNASMKGLTALAIGLSDAYGLGDNTRGELLVQAVKEASELCRAVGGNPETVLGPAGLGDMIATAFSLKSRNRVMGEMLGLGLNPKIANRVATEGMTVEGVKSVAALADLASKANLRAPLVHFVFDVLCRGNQAGDAFSRLWSALEAQSR